MPVHNFMCLCSVKWQNSGTIEANTDSCLPCMSSLANIQINTVYLQRGIGWGYVLSLYYMLKTLGYKAENGLSLKQISMSLVYTEESYLFQYIILTKVLQALEV